MSKKDIMSRIERFGLKPFTARPYPAVVVPYLLDNKRHLKWLNAHLPGYASGSSNLGLCSACHHEDGYRLVLIGVCWGHHDRYSVLAHEVYHAVNFIYEWFGAHHDLSNDEPAAYILQDIYRQTLAALEIYDVKK